MSQLLSNDSKPTRRQFIKQATATGLAIGSSGLSSAALANEHDTVDTPLGKAEHCIMIWLGGGAAQIDTWDPKAMGDARAKKAGAYYQSIDTAIPGTQVCLHLPRCAAILDRFNIIRTLNHDVIDEHARATNRMHTGRVTSGTITYPSVGSIVASQLGPVNPKAPAYMLIGYSKRNTGARFSWR